MLLRHGGSHAETHVKHVIDLKLLFVASPRPPPETPQVDQRESGTLSPLHILTRHAEKRKTHAKANAYTLRPHLGGARLPSRRLQNRVPFSLLHILTTCTKKQKAHAQANAYMLRAHLGGEKTAA